MDQDALGTDLASYADSDSSDLEPYSDILLSLLELVAMTLHFFQLWVRLQGTVTGRCRSMKGIHAVTVNE